MVNQEYYNLGTAPSVIRQLFAYGLEQAAKVGADKVYDYSLGNPSIPAPKKVNESIKKLVDEMDSIKLHGYSMAAGFDTARAAVAKDLAERFGLDVKASELFFTCGAAPALISIIKALIVDADSEIMAVAPFFPEYRPFVNANGGKYEGMDRYECRKATSASWWWSPPTPRHSRSIWTRWKSASRRTPRVLSSTPPIIPPALCIPRRP